MTGLPSPSQARLLRALATYEYARILWNGSGVQLIGPDHWKVSEQFERDGVRLRSPTVRVLVQEGWLEQEGEWAYKLSAVGLEALSELDEDDFISPTPNLGAEDVHRALRAHFAAPEWWYLQEVHVDDWQTRRIDALVLQLIKPHRIWAIEVKVDRGDFLQELDEPMKRRPAQELAHYFAFAAPAGLIKDHELPDGCGLLEVHSRTNVVVNTRPPITRPERPTWELVASLARAAERRAV